MEVSTEEDKLDGFNATREPLPCIDGKQAKKRHDRLYTPVDGSTRVVDDLVDEDGRKGEKERRMIVGLFDKGKDAFGGAFPTKART